MILMPPDCTFIGFLGISSHFSLIFQNVRCIISTIFILRLVTNTLKWELRVPLPPLIMGFRGGRIQLALEPDLHIQNGSEKVQKVLNVLKFTKGNILGHLK